MSNRYMMRVYLKEVLAQRNVTQKELAELTGLRPAVISELANNRRSTLNRDHIAKIAEALDIKRLDELVRFETDA